MEKALHWADAVHFRKVFSATEGLAVQVERGAEGVRGAVMVRGQRGCRVSLCPHPVRLHCIPPNPLTWDKLSSTTSADHQQMSKGLHSKQPYQKYLLLAAQPA